MSANAHISLVLAFTALRALRRQGRQVPSRSRKGTERKLQVEHACTLLPHSASAPGAQCRICSAHHPERVRWPLSDDIPLPSEVGCLLFFSPAVLPDSHGYNAMLRLSLSSRCAGGEQDRPGWQAESGGYGPGPGVGTGPGTPECFGCRGKYHRLRHKAWSAAGPWLETVFHVTLHALSCSAPCDLIWADVRSFAWISSQYGQSLMLQ